MHLLVESELTPEIEPAKNGEAIVAYKGRQSKEGQEFIKLLEHCGFGPIARCVKVGLGRDGVVKYMTKYLSKELRDYKKYPRFFGQGSRIYGWSNNWSQVRRVKLNQNGRVAFKKLEEGEPVEEKECELCASQIEVAREQEEVIAEKNLEEWEGQVYQHLHFEDVILLRRIQTDKKVCRRIIDERTEYDIGRFVEDPWKWKDIKYDNERALMEARGELKDLKARLENLKNKYTSRGYRGPIKAVEKVADLYL